VEERVCRIDSNLGVERCREHILQISADASLRALKAALRGVRRRNTSRSAPVQRSKWVKCFRDTGECAAKPRCASTSPLEEHADCLLTLIADQPHLTLDEVVSAMQKRGIAGSRSPV
jgi:hypothetical protein